jgi:hypothetical protein
MEQVRWLGAPPSSKTAGVPPPVLNSPLACRAEVIATARSIIARGAWCAIEVCRDVAEQRWEPRMLICLADPLVVADAVEEWVVADPDLDVRLAGYGRDGRERDDDGPVLLCHVAGVAVA